MSTSSDFAETRFHKYALVVGRSVLDKNTLELDTLAGVAPTVRNVAVDLVRNGFNVVVLADTPMALSQPALDATLEKQYSAIADDAVRARRLQWCRGAATRQHIAVCVKELAIMVPGHLAGRLDQMVVYVCAHGVANASDGSFGAALGDVQRTVASYTDSAGAAVAACYEGAYTIDKVREDVAVDEALQRWYSTLVVMDTCQAGGSFGGATEPLLHLQGEVEGEKMQRLFQRESYQCLASVPCKPAAFCQRHGTALSTALQRAWLRPPGDGGAFARGRKGAGRWASIGCVVERVNVELATLAQTHPEHFYSNPATCELSRMPWRVTSNTGEFFAFNSKYTSLNKLRMVPVITMSLRDARRS